MFLKLSFLFSDDVPNRTARRGTVQRHSATAPHRARTPLVVAAAKIAGKRVLVENAVY